MWQMFSFAPSTPVLRSAARSVALTTRCPPFRIAQKRCKRSNCYRRAAPTSMRSASGKRQKMTVSPFGIALFLSAIFWAFIVLPLMLILHPFLLILKLTRFQVTLLHFWMRMSLRTSFLPISTKGVNDTPKSPSLIVSNLQSPLDTFILAFLQRPFLLMIPERAKRAPFVGWMLRLSGMIFMSSDRRGQMAALIACTEALKHGKSVAIFPEGVPRLDGVIASFPSAVFSSARKAKVPIVPVTIDGSFRVFEAGFTAIRRPSKSISLTVHKPVSADPDDKKTALDVRNIVRSELPRELQGKP